MMPSRFRSPRRPRTPLATSLLAAAVSMAGSVEVASAQDLHPSRRPSPTAIAKTFVGDTYVKVTYGRPYVRGRDVFGDSADGGTYLVPFGELWRTGANEATEITVTGPVTIAGERLEAGTYSVFTVPGAESWIVRFNTQLGMDGTGRLDPVSGQFSQTYDETDDVVTVEVASGALSEDVDQFTIAFEAADGDEAGSQMVLTWERTEVRIPITGAGAGR